MDMATYKLIGAAYSGAEEKEEWLDNVEQVTDIAVFSYESIRAASSGAVDKRNGIDAGVARILLEGKISV